MPPPPPLAQPAREEHIGELMSPCRGAQKEGRAANRKPARRALFFCACYVRAARAWVRTFTHSACGGR
eukprot:5496017-Prymnesium_polylepis.1